MEVFYLLQIFWKLFEAYKSTFLLVICLVVDMGRSGCGLFFLTYDSALLIKIEDNPKVIISADGSIYFSFSSDADFDGYISQLNDPYEVKYELEKIIYLTPKGKTFDQNKAKKFLNEKKINILCGHFEGIDQRVIESRGIEEISIGDYILSGGETAAYVILDSILRLVPGVLGNENSYKDESFENGLLEYPQYTKPQIWEKTPVPEVLLSGDHSKIKDWRLSQSEAITRHRRPDLWQKYKKN